MSDFNKRNYYIDLFGLFCLGTFSLGYIVTLKGLAEKHIQLPFLNFPIFVGEILLFVCLLLFLAKYIDNPQKFTKWHYLTLGYFIFVIIKALRGYFIWDSSPLALRHAALLYYPAFAVFGYSFYRRDFFSAKNCLILILLISVVFIFGKYKDSGPLTLMLLGFILIKSYPNKTTRLLMFLIFFVIIPYKAFFHTARMMIVGNFVSGLYLTGALPLILEVKKQFKFVLMALIGGIVIVGLLKFADHGAVKSIIAFKKMAEVKRSCDAYIKANIGNFQMEERKEIKFYNPDKPVKGDSVAGIVHDREVVAEGREKIELKKIIVENVKERIASFSFDEVDEGMQEEVKQEIESILDMQLPEEMRESSETLSIKDENQVADVEAVKREIEPAPVAVVQAAQEHSVDLVKTEISRVKDEIQESVVGEMKEETGFVLAVPELEAMVKPSTDSVKTDVEAIQVGVRENDVIQTKMQVESDPIVVVPETLKSSEGQEIVVEGAKGKIEPVLVEAVSETSKSLVETKDVTPVIAASAPDVIQGPLAAAVEIPVPIEEKAQRSDTEEEKAIIRQTIFEQVKQEIRVAPVENMLNGERHQNVTMIDDVKKEMQMAFTEQAKQNVPVVPVKQSNTGWVDNNNAVFRILIWRDMLRDLVREKPIFGFSFGRPFRSVSLEILHWGDGDWAKDGWIEPHNSYLHIIYRTGIVGILFIFSFLFILFKMIKHFILVKSFTGILLCGIIINWFVAANFLVIFELPYTAIPIWTIYGMTFAYCYKTREVDCEEKTAL